MTTCPYCASSLTHEPATCPTCGANLTNPALEIGTRIAGKYRVEDVLGQGGFGITYLAFDTELEHRVAIKELFPEGSTRHAANVIPPPGLDFLETKRKFLEEARVVQRFNHPNIVRVYGTLEENGTAYIVMEALEGATLGADVASNGPFPEETALSMARQLCDALEVVHAAGLLHRDIKPDNVFLASDGRVVLIDFGSARGFAQGQVKRHTRLVTPGYAAPEQYASSAAFGAYTDVYGLAATMYFAVEGHAPPLATDLMLGKSLKFRYAQRLRFALEFGLNVKVQDRPQDIHKFLVSFEHEPNSSGSSSRLTAQTKTLVEGWQLENQLIQRGSRVFSYSDIQLIEITKEEIINAASFDARLQSLVLGCGLCIIGFAAKAFVLIYFGGIVLAVTAFTWFDRNPKSSPSQYRFSVWVLVGGHRELLDIFSDQKRADNLGQALRKFSGARLYSS